MRAVVQRVGRAGVRVAGERVAEIGPGFLVLVGVGDGDTEDDAKWLADKVVELRVFEDDDGKMNRSLLDTGGAMLVVSQFTLHGDCRKGRRPSFSRAARPELAEALYLKFADLVRARGVPIQTGRFQAMMEVELVNQGPVTLMLDSKRNF